MKLITKTFFVFVLIFTASVSSHAQSEWVGEYFFDENGGETAGGTKIYIAHTLKITEKDGKLTAHIYSQGFQTSRDIYAFVKTENGNLELYFEKSGKDHISPNFSKGDRLLTLNKSNSRQKPLVISNWGKFAPALQQNNQSGKIFLEKVLKKELVTADKQWMTLKSSKESFSVQMPADSLINAEKSKIDKQYRSFVYGFENGVSMTLTIYRKKLTKSSLKRMQVSNPDSVRDVNIGKFIVRSVTGEDVNMRYFQTLYFVSKKSTFRLNVTAANSNSPNLIKFLKSIKIGDKPIFKGRNEVAIADGSNTIEKTFDGLQTTREILEAYDRKTLKINRNVSFEPGLVDDSSITDKTTLSREAIIVEYPKPDISTLPYTRIGPLKIVVVVQLLATGQVGDVKVVSAPKENFIKSCCIKNVKNLKFVPAQKNGKNVDVTQKVSFSFQYFGI